MNIRPHQTAVKPFHRHEPPSDPKDPGRSVPSDKLDPPVNQDRLVNDFLELVTVRGETKNERLIAELAGQDDRRARFVCVLALVRSADDPQPIVAEGEWHGQILDAPRGQQGFGYDPLFYLPDLGKTSAELSPDHKNRISHRGNAARLMWERMKGLKLEA